jgi:hypothetical protein
METVIALDRDNRSDEGKIFVASIEDVKIKRCDCIKIWVFKISADGERGSEEV